jgi:protocatechuate 3,4-dioxygenase beta subunit
LFPGHAMKFPVQEPSSRWFSKIVGFARFFGWVAIVAVTSAQTKDLKAPAPANSLGQISGHVYRGNSSEPVSKAQVSLTATQQETYEAAGGQRIVRTDADGAFAFTDLPPGDYQIGVSHNGYAQFTWVQSERNIKRPLRDDRLISLQTGQKIEDLALRLHPAGIIAGQVTDEDHDPVTRLEVWVLAVDYVRGGHRKIDLAGKAVTDDLGDFRVADLPPGPYYVRAGGLTVGEMDAVALKQGPAGGLQYRDTYYPGTTSIDDAQALQVSGDGTSEVQFTVPWQRTYSISGKVLLGSTSAKLVEQVEWKERDEEGFVFSASGDTAEVSPDGSFKIPHMPPGYYTLSAVALRPGRENVSGYASVHIVDSDAHADVEIGQGIEVRGKVEGPQGVSLAGKEITLETFGPGFYLLHPGTIDPTGRFEIKNTPPGEFTFATRGWGKDDSIYVNNAVCNGRDYSSSTFTLTLDTRLECIVTLANDTSAIRGKMADGDKPVTKMVAVLIPESRELRHNQRYTLTSKTDDSGAYSISGVIPGDYLLFAVPPSKNHEYFALDFAEQHGGGEQVRVKPRTTQVVDLKISDPQ